jgi:hypothetical protein
MEIVSPIQVEKLGIEGIKAAVKECKELAAQVKSILAGGVTWEDTKEVPELVKNVSELGQAVQLAIPEAKDIDAEEFKAVALEVIDLVVYLLELFGPLDPAHASQHGIQGILDTLDVCKDLARSVKEVLADGKVGIGDIKELPSLLSNMNVLFASIKVIGPELKDLDASEIKRLAVEGIELVLFVMGLLSGAVK